MGTLKFPQLSTFDNLTDLGLLSDAEKSALLCAHKPAAAPPSTPLKRLKTSVAVSKYWMSVVEFVCLAVVSRMRKEPCEPKGESAHVRTRATASRLKARSLSWVMKVAVIEVLPTSWSRWPRRKGYAPCAIERGI
jgi:hypothetical protein